MIKMVDYAPLSKVWSDTPIKPTGGASTGKSKKKAASASREREKTQDPSSLHDFENIFDKFLSERSFTNMDALYPKMAKENTYDMDFPQNAFVKQDPTQQNKNEPVGIADDEIGIENAYRFEDLLKDNKLSAYGHDAPLDLSVDQTNALKHHKNMKLYDQSREENAKCTPFEIEDEESTPMHSAHEAHPPLPVSEENEDPRIYYNNVTPELDEVYAPKQQDTTTQIFNLVLYLVSGIFMIFMFELVYMLSKR